MCTHNFKYIVELLVSADNCPTNVKLCNDAETNMKGCDSHKLHLAVVQRCQALRKRRTGWGQYRKQPRLCKQVVISKVDHCMKDLGQPKNAALLRTKTRLRPEKRIKIRQSSLFSVLKRWLRIRRSVTSVPDWPADFLDLIPTAHDNHMIEEHIRKLGNFESVSKKLQSSGDKRATKFLSVKGAPG